MAQRLPTLSSTQKSIGPPLPTAILRFSSTKPTIISTQRTVVTSRSPISSVKTATPSRRATCGSVPRRSRVAVLVVANAQGAPLMRSPEAANPAFETAECDAVYEWICGGGSLLLIADHHPWGASTERLATRLGVDMGKSMAADPANSETGLPGQLNFSRVNKLLGEHPILTGRDGSERIDRVLTFAGQSLKGPKGSVAALQACSVSRRPGASNPPGSKWTSLGTSPGSGVPLGRGKVVVLGEAAMLSAQINGRMRAPMGMNVPGTDNRQFALNLMHWLAGVKFPDLSARLPQNPTRNGPRRGAAVASTRDQSIRRRLELGDHARQRGGRYPSCEIRAAHSRRPRSRRSRSPRSP